MGGGSGMALLPSTSVTLYLVWKTIEALFSAAARKGIIPAPQAVVHVIYAMACAELFYAVSSIFLLLSLLTLFF